MVELTDAEIDSFIEACKAAPSTKTVHRIGLLLKELREKLPPIVVIENVGGVTNWNSEGAVDVVDIDWDNMKDCDTRLDDLIDARADVEEHFLKRPDSKALFDCIAGLDELIAKKRNEVQEG